MHLSSKCKTILFPYIYNSALWLLLTPSIADGYVADYSDINKYINSEPIKKLKSKGFSINEVLQMYKTGEIDFEYKDRFSKSIDVLKEKEKMCDVTVSDFIVKNIKNIWFFILRTTQRCVFWFIV